MKCNAVEKGKLMKNMVSEYYFRFIKYISKMLFVEIHECAILFKQKRKCMRQAQFTKHFLTVS